MWTLVNDTAFAGDRTWVRDKTGVHHWIVAIRATFSLAADGSTKIAAEQVPPKLAAEYWGEPGASSLHHEGDLSPLKPSTDVLIVGSAHAPGGKPARSVRTRLRVEHVDKSIDVFGDRLYYSGPMGIGISDPARFVTQPIRYEGAYGGSDQRAEDPQQHLRDSRNPVGRGVARNARELVGTPAHVLELPGKDAQKAGPAGYGPIASYWSPRQQYAGTYDAAWAQRKRPLLPDDYDDRFVLCAPHDQQTRKHLKGGELVELTNLTPGGRLLIELPTVSLRFSTAINGRTEEHPGQLASVVLEPDEGRLTLVFQSSLLVRAKETDYLDATYVRCT
jgi:hypothetical protein